MAVETFLLKPKLDKRALAEVKKAMVAFERGAGAMDATTKRTRTNSRAWGRDLEKSESTLRKMSVELRKAEKILGKEADEVRRMRKDMLGAYAAQDKLRKGAAKAVESERKSAEARARAAASEKRIADYKKQTLADQRRIEASEKRSLAAAERGYLRSRGLLEKAQARRAKEGAERRSKLGGGIVSGAREGVRGAMRGAARAAGGAAALGLVGVAAGYALLEKTRSAADRAAKSANLGVEEFGRLKHAAELSGTSIEVVEKSAATLESLLSKKPTAEFTGGLKALGIEAKQLRGLKPEQQLSLIADAMQGVEDDQLRTVISSRLFGEEMGAKLVPMLQGGGAALRAMGDDAEALGLVFDEKTAAAAERFGDAQDRLTKSLSGFTQEIFSSYMPALADATEGAVAWIQSNREAITAWIEDVVQKLISAGEAAAEWAQSVDWAQVWEEIKKVGEVLAEVIDFFLTLTSTLGGTAVAAGVLTVAIVGMLGPIGAVAAAGAAIGYAIGSALQYVKKEIQGVSMDLGRLAGRMRDIRGQSEALAEIQRLEAGDEAAAKKAAETTARNAELSGKADRAGARARAAAKKIYGNKVPASVQRDIAQMERIISTGSASDASRRAAMATLNKLEGRAAKKGAGARRKALSEGEGAAPEKSAASAAVASDIKSFSETAGKGAYARAIQAGKSEREANKAALAEQKRVAKDLKARAPELIKAGTLGQGTSALAGTPLTAGGALPIALDLGSKGGPPPVQIVNAPTNFTFDFPDARFDATMEDFGPMIEPKVKSALAEMWGRLLPVYAGGQIR